jgi:thiopeptide-type bacteriocin biosynthesis protein
MTDASQIAAADFFVLRLPASPTAALSGLRSAFKAGSDLIETEFAQSPAAREAIFLASSSLYSKLYDQKETSPKLQNSLAKYLYRMATRCTPYGTFAGVALGEVGDSTRLEIDNAMDGRRVARLDQGVVSDLQSRLLQKNVELDLLRTLNVVANNSLWHAPDGYRYVEAVRGGTWTHYELSRVAPTAPIQWVLEEVGLADASFSGLALRLSQRFEQSLEAAELFLKALVQEQVLLCGPQLAVTGDDVVGDFLGALAPLEMLSETVAPVTRAARLLSDTSGERTPNVQRYQAAIEELKTAGLSPDPAKAIQIDLHIAAPDLAISREFVQTITDDLWALRPMLSRTPSQLTQFSADFERQYGDRRVPLLEALDEDMGVGYGGGSKLKTPLVSGLAHGREQQRSQVWFRDVDAYLLGRVLDAATDSQHTIHLEDDDVRKFGVGQGTFPSSMAALGSIFDWQNGNLGFDLSALFGPPAALLLGRFCCGSPDLTERVRKLVEATEPTTDDVIVAELAHLPDGRVGNVILRPVLRSHEITYLGGSGAPADAQIPASDLDVFCRNGIVHLESRSRGRRVQPRLTNAHNFDNSLNLPIYRFLGALQSQGEPGFGWGWGPILNALPWLPALQYRGLRLSRERWRLYGHETKAVVDEGDAAIDRLLLERKISPTVRAKQADNFLELDLRHGLDRALFREECRRNPILELEAAPTSNLVVRDRQGNGHEHEIVIPLHRTSERAPASKGAIRTVSDNVAAVPGSEWLYARIFCGLTTMDRWLRTQFAEIADFAAREGCSKIFFIRYSENGTHLRLRIRGNPDALWGPVRQRLEESLADDIATRSVSRMEYATYQPEFGRYGGVEGLDRSEHIFSADSLAVAKALGRIADRPDKEELRWQFGLASVWGLVNAFGLDPAHEAAAIASLRQGYWDEFGIRSADQLNAKYREKKKLVDRIVAGQPDELFADVLAERDLAVRPHAAALLSTLEPPEITPLIHSLVHMCANRVFPEKARLHELAILHLLQKGIDAVAARQKYRPDAAASAL